MSPATYATTVKFTDNELALISSLSLPSVQAIDASNQYAGNRDAKRLGKKLFFEKRLSANGEVSCASCHDFEKSLTDGRDFPVTLGVGTKNTPTLINMFLGRWFFWDGRSDSLWSQAFRPIESQTEMGGNWKTIYALFLKDNTLFTAYNNVFQEYPLSANIPFSRLNLDRFKTNIGKAIAAFEMDIQQFNSRFDLFVKDINAGNLSSKHLSDNEQHGLKLFLGKGLCIRCHSGPNFSDGAFHSIRLPSSLTQPSDNGRFGAIESLKADPYNTLGQFSDDRSMAKTKFIYPNNELWGAYKTPTLRNIEHTAPYMHDASFKTLEAVITHYSTLKGAPAQHHKGPQLLKPANFSKEEAYNLQLFLRALSGEVEIPSYN